MGVSPKELMKREFECIKCGMKIIVEVKKSTKPIRNIRCDECKATRQYFATDTLKRIDQEESEE